MPYKKNIDQGIEKNHNNLNISSRLPLMCVRVVHQVLLLDWLKCGAGRRFSPRTQKGRPAHIIMVRQSDGKSWLYGDRIIM